MTTLFERNEDRVIGFLKWTDFKTFVFTCFNDLTIKNIQWVREISEFLVSELVTKSWEEDNIHTNKLLLILR